ncbi:GDP-L-fucose synthase [Rhodospirillaceae bacterium RKSG073]|nr:GDP-L-fucose synthase [Curvivirga aplysinae]
MENKKIWVAGHNGMVGSAIVRSLQHYNRHILTTTRQELDLTNQQNVMDWIKKNKPDTIFLAAAKVGGIHANNSYPAEFIYDNLTIETNIIHAAHLNNVEKLVFLGSSCIYPRNASQPISEDELLTGELESTNEWYAIAKIAGIKLCQAYKKQYGCDFISVMPTNLYGPGDNFHPENSHVPAALLDRFHQAKMCDAPKVEVWGSGTPFREFLYVDDLADACIYLSQHYTGVLPVNVGTGADLSIRDFAHLIAKTVGYKGEIVFDTSRPDGTPRKVLNVSKLADLGWTYSTELSKGLKLYYDWYLENIQTLRNH